MGSEFSPYNDRPLACGEVSGIHCLDSWRDLLFVGTLIEGIIFTRAEKAFDLIKSFKIFK
jgi:hypothetical protein